MRFHRTKTSFLFIITLAAAALLVALLGFVAAFAMAMGPIPWIVPRRSS